MRRQPTQLNLMFFLLMLAVTAAVELIIYVMHQMLDRCGSLCGGLWAESVIRMFSR